MAGMFTGATISPCNGENGGVRGKCGVGKCGPDNISRGGRD